MIKYKEINDGKNVPQDIWTERKSFPIKQTFHSGTTIWTIPGNYRLSVLGYCYHREDGPAIEYHDNIKVWHYYGQEAESEKEFYDPVWRRKIEIKEFL